MPSNERCRNCGCTFNEHDWDGACPTCEDDAALFAENNLAVEPADELTHAVDAAFAEGAHASRRDTLEQLDAAVRDYSHHITNRLVVIWPIPLCCKRHHVFAHEMLRTYHGDAHARCN